MKHIKNLLKLTHGYGASKKKKLTSSLKVWLTFDKISTDKTPTFSNTSVLRTPPQINYKILSALTDKHTLLTQ